MAFLSLEEVRSLILRPLEERGVEGAERVVDHLVEAELRGHSSHGLQRLIPLVRGLDRGTISPRLSAVTLKRSDSSLLVDAKSSIGIVLWSNLIEKEDFSVPVKVICVRNSSHIGFLGYYTYNLAQRGLVSLMLGNGEPGIVRPGTGRPIVSTSPLSVGIPPSYVLDLSMAVSSRGRILERMRRGERIPLGWAVDPQGEETEDPAEALKGGLLPIGGQKGFLMAMTFDLLVSFLTGSAVGTEVRGVLNIDLPPNKGEVLFVLNPGFFEARVEALSRMREVYGRDFPGEHGLRIREERLQLGMIEVDETLLSQIRSL